MGQEHTHAWVCSALTDLVLAVLWRNAGPYLGMAFGPTQWPVPSGMKQPWLHYGLWNCRKDKNGTAVLTSGVDSNSVLVIESPSYWVQFVANVRYTWKQWCAAHLPTSWLQVASKVCRWSRVPMHRRNAVQRSLRYTNQTSGSLFDILTLSVVNCYPAVSRCIVAVLGKW